MELVTFSVLLIREVIPNPASIQEKVMEAISSILNIRSVKQSEFLTYTRTKPIPRYILVAKEQARKELEKAKEFLASGKEFKREMDLNKKYDAIQTDEADQFDSAKLTDPSYAIIDIHGGSMGTYVTIKRNVGIPMEDHRLLKKMATTLSKWFVCDVIAVEKSMESAIEHVSQFTSGRQAFSRTAPSGSKLLTEYLGKTKIDINTILSEMDNNIDVLMAPQDLEDYRQIQEKHLASQAYLESMGLPDKNPDLRLQQDYADLLDELKTINMNMKIVADRITQDPKLTTTYIKFMNPTQLKEFGIRKLESAHVEKLH